MKFKGTLKTDGVGVSLIKQNFSPERRDTSGNYDKKPLKEDNDEFRYIYSLSKNELDNTMNKCVLIDPGKHDLLFCMHESSSRERKKVFRFTKNQRSVKTKARRFSKLQKFMKPAYIQELETYLSKTPAATIDIQKYTKYTKYIKCRSKVLHPLIQYYSSEGFTLNEPEIRLDHNDNEEANPGITVHENPDPASGLIRERNKFKTFLQNLRFILIEKKTQVLLEEGDLIRSRATVEEVAQCLQNLKSTRKEFESKNSTIKGLLESIKEKFSTLKF